MRLLIHFARFGPYHHARLRAAHEVLTPLGWEVLGLETAGTDATYDWDESKGDTDGPKVTTAFPGRVHEEITAAEYCSTLFPLLEAIQPTHMAIAGWGSTDAQMCLSWCRKHDVRRIVMSETRAADGRRVWWKELIKRYLISRFEGALVGGKSHRDYLVKLGMHTDRIAFGYNVVDNDFFKAESGKWKAEIDEEDPARSALQLSAFTPKYFLASNRFIERKNLSRLIEAYSSYIRQSTIHNHQSSINSPTWNLCLLGDGELKSSLIAQCHSLGLQVSESVPWEVEEKAESGKHKAEPSELNQGIADAESISTSSFQLAAFPSPTVFFPGFRQIEELPRFYAHAGCFIHPALDEPWGLVINEAMVCGLPILSSSNVGAAEELVDDGVNGWKFDPLNVEKMARHMITISAFNFPLSAFCDSSRRLLEERCSTSTFGQGLAGILSPP